MIYMRSQNTRAFHTSLLLTLSCIISFTVLSFSPSPASAGSWYVKPSAEVPVRTGKGTGFKILAVIPDGLQVDVLEEEETWAKIRTPGGTEGWMTKRYLSKDKPLSEVVASLESQKTKIEAEEEELRKRYDELSSAYSLNESELNTCLVERNDITNTYQTLQTETADVIGIKKSLKKSVQEVKEIRQKLALIEQENFNLKRNSAVKWFMAGGSVLFLGWIIGIMTGKSKKRKSSLY